MSMFNMGQLLIVLFIASLFVLSVYFIIGRDYVACIDDARGTAQVSWTEDGALILDGCPDE